ncbi:MAG: TIGR03619 family F420-dependent LLM class oxidoreductase [Pseudomonadales bacterium]|nr:TIGR03619 family F420-dependent LLM class oxidoreductase [Pseudomonadales bacterium]
MKIGLFSTFMSPRADRTMLRDFAVQAESIGVHSIWMGEHVVLFDETEHPYPGAKDGKLPVPAGGGLLDTVATFGFLAAVTEKIRFGTGISLISQRNPLYTAKEFATLDWLSNGRVDFGVGVGWCKEEVIASGYTWPDRGARSNEFLELLKVLWTESPASFAGEHFNVASCHMDPKPVQNPHVPIIVGGHSKNALQRAARYGDGWYGFQLNAKATAPIVVQLRALLEQEGRDPAQFKIVITPTRNDQESIDGFTALGVDELVLHLGSQKPEAVETRLREVEALIS